MKTCKVIYICFCQRIEPTFIDNAGQPTGKICRMVVYNVGIKPNTLFILFLCWICLLEIGIYSLAQNHKLPVNKIKWLTRDLSIEALFFFFSI